jgi:hypothetical protein
VKKYILSAVLLASVNCFAAEIGDIAKALAKQFFDAAVYTGAAGIGAVVVLINLKELNEAVEKKEEFLKLLKTETPYLLAAGLVLVGSAVTHGVNTLIPHLPKEIS